jgi:DNA-directed RNA polymerase beta subunit
MFSNLNKSQGLLKSNFSEIYKAYHLNGEYDTLAKFHLDSFNKFVEEDITKILLGYNPIVIEENLDKKKIKGILEFTNIYCTTPFCISPNQKKVPIYPNECRILKKTYSFSIFIHYKFTIK